METVLKNTREVNMQKRRERILERARKVISEEGFDALNLRALAKSAEVTVPTIYNLIGNKEDVLIAVISESHRMLEVRLSKLSETNPIALAEAAIIESTKLFATYENFYRAAFMADDQISPTQAMMKSGEHAEARFIQWLIGVSRLAQSKGVLRGNISAESTGEHLQFMYRTLCKQWAYRMISLDQCREKALIGVYMILAADANDDARVELIKKIQSLEKLSKPKKRSVSI